MATEIRIPVTVEMIANKTNAPKTTSEKSSTEAGKQATTTTKASSGVGQAISAGLLIDSTKKLLSASGNSKATAVIEKGMRFGTLGVRALSGDPTAMIGLAVESLAEIMKYVQKLKAEAQVNNQAQYNRILNGTLYIGNNAEVSTNWVGKINYNKR